jgi:long-chain acyl-CoA synthetase
MLQARELVDGDEMVLLTGATGLVGMEVLARYLQRTDRRVCALVRADDWEHAAVRMRQTLRMLFGEGDGDDYADRVLAVPGDIEADGLGLDDEQRLQLAAGVRDIIHCAASVSFTLPLAQLREINVDGTRRTLEFAELCRHHGGLGRFCHVSTAYVAGDHKGKFREDQLEVGQRFNNPYERSKFEAEIAVREYGDRLPIKIVRPSIIVGERDTGWTVSFNVLYAPLRGFAGGAYVALPGRREAPVDVVPVDYVADALFELAQQPGGAGETGPQTYHLVAGAHASTVGELVELSARYFKRRPPPLLWPALYRRVLHPVLVGISSGKRRRALRRSEIYFPYFCCDVRFDDVRARRALEPVALRTAPITQYFRRLADFAVGAEWGRVAVPRTTPATHAAPTTAGARVHAGA